VAAYAEGALFAQLVKESQLWHCDADGTYWPVMVIASPNEAVNATEAVSE
jgi:hypothetical protein